MDVDHETPLCPFDLSTSKKDKGAGGFSVDVDHGTRSAPSLSVRGGPLCPNIWRRGLALTRAHSDTPGVLSAQYQKVRLSPPRRNRAVTFCCQL
jgi:hypothetical protein